MGNCSFCNNNPPPEQNISLSRNTFSIMDTPIQKENFDPNNFIFLTSNNNINSMNLNNTNSTSLEVGIIKWHNDSFFKGTFHNNISNGWGIYTHPLVGTYKGFFVNDIPKGYGIYTHVNKSVYEGEWDEKQYGIGVEKWVDGSFYEGGFENGCKKGIGKYVFMNGDVYYGEWENNLMCGKGIFCCRNWIFLGEFLNGVKFGYGEYFVDESLFVGYFKNNLQNGFFMFFNREKIVVGFKLNGKIDGLCRVIDKNEEKFMFLRDGKKNRKFVFDKEKIEDFFEENNKKFICYFRKNKKELNEEYEKRMKFKKEIEEFVLNSKCVCFCN